MRIGIGVVSYQRPKHLDLWREQVIKHTPEVTEISIYIDEPRRGIAYGKNQNLKDLKDCDYIFLMDSDCFPIKEGWANFFIMAHQLSGQHHFLYLRETSTIKKIKEHCVVKENGWGINQYDNCAGCFMFLTKEVIERVGAFGEYPFYYGYEHAAFSHRIHSAGLTPMGAYLCPQGIDEYIYPLDYRSDMPFNRQVNHKPSITEFGKIQTYLNGNAIAYAEDIKTIYKPL